MDKFEALGRADVNDIASILADDAIDFGTTEHHTVARGDTVLTWDYERTRPGLSKLYERAKKSQWNGSTQLDWSIEVDIEKVANEMQGAVHGLRERLTAIDNSPLKSWGDPEWTKFSIEAFNWRMSQLRHWGRVASQRSRAIFFIAMSAAKQFRSKNWSYTNPSNGPCRSSPNTWRSLSR